MMTPRICAAAVIALAVAAPFSPAQEKPESMATKLLERLNAMANRLDDQELEADIRAELRDLMEMLREQLGGAKAQLNYATDEYMKAAVEGLRSANLGDVLQLQGQTLKALQGVDFENLRGQALKALQGIQEIDFSKFEGQFDALKSLGTLQKFDDFSGQLEKFQASLDRADFGNLFEKLRSGNFTAQEGNADAIKMLLERAQEPETSAAVKKVLEAVRGALQAVDDDTVNDILETVRKAVQEASKDTGAAEYLRAANLYRALGEGVSRGLNYTQFRERAEENRENTQEYREDWRKVMEAARKDWEKESEQAREQWQRYIERGRRDMEAQLEKALESYRRALQRRRGTGDASPFAVLETEGGGVFFPTGTGTYSYSFPEGTSFNFTQDPDSSAWRVTTPGGGFVFGGDQPAWPVKIPEGGFVFGEGGNFWTVEDPKGATLFKMDPEKGWSVFEAPEGEPGEAKVFFTAPGGEPGEARAFFSAPEGGSGQFWGVIRTPEGVEDDSSFLELFKRDRKKDSLMEIEELEREDVELQELELLEEVELQEFELAELELVEPVLELTLEPKLMPIREPGVQIQIEKMVDELREEMREIRELVRTLRQKVKDKNPR